MNLILSPEAIADKTFTPSKLKTKPKSMRTLHAEAIRDKIAKRVADELDPMLDAQIKIAKDTDKPQAVTAFKTLLEHSSGRPKESIDITAKIGIIQLIQELDDEGEE